MLVRSLKDGEGGGVSNLDGKKTTATVLRIRRGHPQKRKNDEGWSLRGRKGVCTKNYSGKERGCFSGGCWPARIKFPV